MKIRKRWLIAGTLFISATLCSIPELTHKNKGTSVSIGSVRNGKLENGWLMPYRGNNFHFFSAFSYFILNNGYVHSRVYKVLNDAYATCASTCPDREFIVMECTRKHGGRMIFHWTHQNGLSADLMVPKINGNNTDVWMDHIGLFHYLLKFDEKGRSNLNDRIQIDFETMAQHLLAIEDACRRNNIRIRKVLFHTDLHDELFGTPSGKLLRQRDIHFITRLSDFVNSLHDDHYHIDFEID